MYAPAVALSFATRPALVALASLLLPATAQAHFVLSSPPAMTEQNALGDPQKMPPCGDDGTATPTGAVTTFQAGETITIEIDETIYHPGHYRVALAINDPSELPDPAPVTPDADSPCGTAPIDPAPVFPVLADGELLHDAPFGKPQTIQVTLPSDISCDGCTLQVIQFMTDHALNNPGGCYYHHCATIAIEGGVDGDTGPGDDTGPAATDDGMTTMPPGDDSSGGGADDGTASNSGGGSGGPGADDGAMTTSGFDTDPDPGFTGDGDDDKGGCACTLDDDDGFPGGLAVLAGVFALAAVRLRRRG